MPVPADPPRATTLALRMGQKRRLLVQMLAVGARQGELIETGDVAALVKLLAAKQQLIAALGQLERSLDPFRKEDPDARDWRSPADRTACAADADACARLLDEVVALERRHEEAMSRRRDGLAAELRKTLSAHHAASAYQPHRRPGAPLSAAQQVASPATTIDQLTSG